MPRTAKSQWDFGELFPTAATRRVWTVVELTGQVRRLLEQHIGQVWVTGEVTNLRAQSSGHLYFTLKDASAQLSCVLFRGEAGAARDLLQDGQKVLLQGEVTVYEPRGQYQLRVAAVELQGVGALQLAFEKLKRKLQAEGLFASERKRPLPRFPRRIGLATSPTGAALRDVLHVIQRRYPVLEIVLAPCRVQGEGAAEEVAAGIRQLNEWSARQPAAGGAGLDLILLTRGGGSLEDLWAFNEEAVARAIFESVVPVVSAVGHEIDFTISDFVADLRAATPSAAAEIITEGMFASVQALAEVPARLRQLARDRLEREQEGLEHLRQRLRRAHPRARLEDHWQRLDDLQASLLRAGRGRCREARARLDSLVARWRRLRLPQALARRGEVLARTHGRLLERARFHWRHQQQRWETLQERLRLLSPERVLARGYSVTMDARSGRIIRSQAQAQRGQVLRTRLHQGEIRSVVD